ncbi:MAG: glycosyltransferase [Acidobacteriota bacterium]|nr:glycosyltransferase [Acidobacteriota bacterium]
MIPGHTDWSKRWHRGVVTINGEWPEQPAHVHSFFNPCLTEQELSEAKTAGLNKQLSGPLRLLYVGHLLAEKGVTRVLDILACLRREGCDAYLDIIGDGPERVLLEALATDLNVSDAVKLHGWLARPLLAPLYAQAHFMLLPTESEGWPKVLSEAMAYGAVPLSSDVSSIPQYLKEFGTGKVYRPEDIESFADAIIRYSNHPEEWKRESHNGIEAAVLFSYDNYLDAVCRMLDLNDDSNSSRNTERLKSAININ